MKMIYLLIISSLFLSCRKKKESGFKIVIECSIPKINKVVLNEKDIVKVDWANQEYFLKDSILENFKFNNKVCFGGCNLKTFLNGDELYEVVLYCDIAPNNLSTRNKNIIFIKAGDKTLNLFYQNKLQLNLNDRRKITENIEKQKKSLSFLYDKKLKEYLQQKSLLK